MKHGTCLALFVFLLHPTVFTCLFPHLSFLTLFIFLLRLSFQWVVGRKMALMYQSRKKKNWGWWNLYCWSNWNWMDWGLGGAKDQLLTLAFMMTCVGTVRHAICRRLVVSCCIHYSKVIMDNSIGSLLDVTSAQCNTIQAIWWRFQPAAPVLRLRSEWKWSQSWHSSITSDAWLYCKLLSLFSPLENGLVTRPGL